MAKYADGQEVKLGDRVSLGQDDQGVVVALIEKGEFGPRHHRDQWAYLKSGVLVEFPSYGLIHYESPEPDLSFIERKR